MTSDTQELFQLKIISMLYFSIAKYGYSVNQDTYFLEYEVSLMTPVFKNR